MKKITGWGLAWLLYWLGHLTSKLIIPNDFFNLYDVYNWFMYNSSVIQDWSGSRYGPWLTVNT